MLRLEARNSEVPIERKPPWIKTRLRTGPAFTQLRALVRSEGLHTVCEEAGCPNIYECWEDREATFLIGGDQCTRRCDFCQIDTGKPLPLDEEEPRRVAESVASMGLKYATVTGVARDDLADGGAWLYAQVCREIHAAVPGCGVELLIPDFNADAARLAEVFGARPEVLAHNIETVPRIFRRIRPGFRYPRSLEVLRAARESTKGNVLAVVQPHRFTRLAALFDQFCTCFNDADTVIVDNVYPAGEAPIAGVDRDALVQGLRTHGHRHVIALDGPEMLAELVVAAVEPGDYVVCLGAGSITQWAYALPAKLAALEAR